MNAPTLTSLLALLMAVQAALGLLLTEQYRDIEWIKATWFGNDWITLLLAVPLLLVGATLALRGSVRGLLLWLGTIGYAAYNYSFYVFGAALNTFFPLYVILLVLAVVSLILLLAHLDVVVVARSFSPRTPARLIGAYLVFVALGLTTVWMAMWAAHVFGGRALPTGPEAFKVVAALDLSMMVPALAVGGVLLWRRDAWGYVIAAIAGIQGALYLLVLSLNSAIAIRRGLAGAPGELPIWGVLTVCTTAAAWLLLRNVHAERANFWRTSG